MVRLLKTKIPLTVFHCIKSTPFIHDSIHFDAVASFHNGFDCFRSFGFLHGNRFVCVCVRVQCLLAMQSFDSVSDFNCDFDSDLEIDSVITFACFKMLAHTYCCHAEQFKSMKFSSHILCARFAKATFIAIQIVSMANIELCIPFI